MAININDGLIKLYLGVYYFKLPGKARKRLDKE